MSADAGRRSGSHHLTWGGLRTSRTLVPEVVLYTQAGQERIIEIRSKRELLRLLAAGYDCLAQIEQAEEIRRAREEGKRAARDFEALFGTRRVPEGGGDGA